MEWSVDATENGVLNVVLTTSLTQSTLAPCIEALAAVPRYRSATRLHVSHPLTLLSASMVADVVRELSRVFRHCPCLEWSLVGVKSAPPLDELARLWRDEWCAATPLPRHLQLHLDGRHAMATSDLNILEPYLTGLHVQAKTVAPTLMTSLGSLTRLTAVSLDKMFSSWTRNGLASFLSEMAPSPLRQSILPHLTSLSLRDNMFSSADVVAIATTLRHNSTLTHLSMAYSMPRMTTDMAQWLGAGLLRSPYSRLVSFNLSGLSIQLDNALTMASCRLGHLVPGLSDETNTQVVPPGMYSISTVMTQHEEEWVHANGTSVVEVVASNALQVAVLVPGQGGIAWLDRSFLLRDWLNAVVAVDTDHFVTSLVADDLTSPQPVLLALLASFPALRLERLRVRRYHLSGDELREVLHRYLALRELDIKACGLTDVSPLIEAWELPQTCRLHRLNMAKNLVGAVGAAAVFRHLHLTNLHALDMSKCCIGDASLDILDDALKTNTTLEAITLDATALVDQLAKAHHGQPLRFLPLPMDVQDAFFRVLHRKQHPHVLDASVVQAIFEFAAPVAHRSVRQVQ